MLQIDYFSFADLTTMNENRNSMIRIP